MSTHDLTRPTWGRNISFIRWDSEKGEGRAFVWLTPGPKNGDTLIVRSENGTMPLVVSKVKWLSNVDDMYEVKIARTAGSCVEGQQHGGTPEEEL